MCFLPLRRGLRSTFSLAKAAHTDCNNKGPSTMKLSNRKRRQRHDLALLPPDKRREVIAFFQRGCIAKEWFERKPASPKHIRRLFAA